MEGEPVLNCGCVTAGEWVCLPVSKDRSSSGSYVIDGSDKPESWSTVTSHAWSMCAFDKAYISTSLFFSNAYFVFHTQAQNLLKQDCFIWLTLMLILILRITSNQSWTESSICGFLVTERKWKLGKALSTPLLNFL